MDNIDWLGELVQSMDDLGWEVYSFDHEDGVGQFEVDFKFTDALGAADRLVFLRWMSHEIARRHGGFASWMPKPSSTMAGSGCHFNISLGAADGEAPPAGRRAAPTCLDIDLHVPM
jgi:glutamine synthetase